MESLLHMIDLRLGKNPSFWKQAMTCLQECMHVMFLCTEGGCTSITCWIERWGFAPPYMTTIHYVLWFVILTYCSTSHYYVLLKVTLFTIYWISSHDTLLGFLLLTFCSEVNCHYHCSSWHGLKAFIFSWKKLLCFVIQVRIKYSQYNHVGKKY